MAEFLGVHAFSLGELVGHWWQWVLLGIIATGVAVGTASILHTISQVILKHLKKDPNARPLPKRIARHVAEISKSIPQIPARTAFVEKPASFGVFLGTVPTPPTEAQLSRWSQWDMLIVDWSQAGRVDEVFLEDVPCPRQVIGRLDMSLLTNPGYTASDDQVIRLIQEVFDMVKVHSRQWNRRKRTSGVLLAGWERTLSTPAFNALVKLVGSLHMVVYLEISPPAFLEDAKSLDFQPFAGVVIRNATILPNGEARDFFRMDRMKSTVKAFVSQSCLRPFSVMMWETIDDDVELSHAVARRSFSWCRYYGALVWIASVSSLTASTVVQLHLEPLSAFSWLKESGVMKMHSRYTRTRRLADLSSRKDSGFAVLQRIFPSIRHITAATDKIHNDFHSRYSSRSASETSSSRTPNSNTTTISELDASILRVAEEQSIPTWSSRLDVLAVNPLCSSITGVPYDSLGCFPVGLGVSIDDFTRIVESQRRLRRLNLLDRLGTDQVYEIGVLLQRFGSARITSLPPDTSSSICQFIRDFSRLLLSASDSETTINPVEIYLGLDSGFHSPTGAQFWSVYETDMQSGALVIYVSKTATDLPGTLLHTYLSTRSCDRSECFAAELALHHFQHGSRSKRSLFPRFALDLGLLTPTDILLFLQHLEFSRCEENDVLLKAIRLACEEHLLALPSFDQLKRLGNIGYLSGSVTDVDLVDARLAWYRQNRCTCPSRKAALSIFKEIDSVFRAILRRRDSDNLALITTALESMIRRDIIDPYTDIIVFSIFCAARTVAFDEIYLEVSDRNPLFNEYSDQSAAFAELFALGSRCEAYFDISPSSFGKLLSDRHRAYYTQPEHQPPMWIENAPAFASAYASAQTDIDVDQKESTMPSYRRFTLLSVFAIPALIDIMLLTTTGRGLYLSAYMTTEEQRSATLALMMSLIISGAIGTWISIGGTYYLISMAFSAAYMFMLKSLVGGLAFTLFCGFVGLVVISVKDSFNSGFIFSLYLVSLTCYLSALAVLSSFQFPGSSFLNGRVIIICLIPILGISPIVTMWIHGHDSIVYLSVIYVFVCALLLGIRSTGSKWVTWCSDITSVDDTAVKNWYLETCTDDRETAFAGLTEPAAMALSRDQLHRAVDRERRLWPWSKHTADPIVKKLAASWDSTLFLLDWYCRLSGVKRPKPYSSTWNIEVSVAHDSMLQAQKGIRLHSSFIHWRNAGDEIGCGILYFLVALLDKWVQLVAGQPLLGLSAATNDAYRMAVGFGLAYYLIGVVLLDYKAQHLHELGQGIDHVTVRSVGMIQVAALQNAKCKRRMYWTTFYRFLGVHVWAAALTATLLWIFDASENALIMYLAYVGAYSGLLLYQYNKIFSGPHALIPLLSAFAIGFPIGLALRKVYPHSPWNNVIALAVGTWTAALFSLHTAKLTNERRPRALPAGDPGLFHACSGLGGERHWSQSELEAFYNAICLEPSDVRSVISEDGSLGRKIRAILLSRDHDSLSKLAQKAFPEASDIIRQILCAWKQGSMSVELVRARALSNPEADLIALSRTLDGTLHLLVVLDPHAKEIAYIVAEKMLHAFAETLCGMSHEQACIFETLRTCDNEEDGYVSESLKHAISSHPGGLVRERLIQSSQRELLQNLCFGFRVDTAWDMLSLEVRRHLLNRSLGRPLVFTNEASELQSLLRCGCDCDLYSEVARYDLGALAAINKYHFYRNCGRTGHGLTSKEKSHHRSVSGNRHTMYGGWEAGSISSSTPMIARLTAPLAASYHVFGTWIKFFFLAWMADVEYQRELDCTLGRKPYIIARPVGLSLNTIWTYAEAAQAAVLPLFLFHNRKDVRKLWSSIAGTSVSLLKGRAVLQSPEKTSTAFVSREADTGFKLYFWSGLHKKQPKDQNSIETISTFTNDMHLLSRTEFAAGAVANEYVYEYPAKPHGSVLKKSHEIPLSRTCISGKSQGAIVQYNRKGHIESGSYMQHGNYLRFKYYYRKNARFDDELLRAEFSLPHMFCSVSWCAPPVRHPSKLDRWIPNSRPNEAIFVQGSDVYESQWTYDHKFHPTIVTTLNGQAVETPPMIRHDWLGILEKPTRCTFVSDNPLFFFRSPEVGVLTRLFRLNSKRLPVSTGRARSELWRAWKSVPQLDAIIVRWLDERLLRADRMLKPYWRKRDIGNLLGAEDYLALHADAVMASSELSNDISPWTPLAIKMSDLFSFGRGGDAVVFTRTKTLQADTDDSMHVIAVDTGTWPNEGGGVSACRRDMINNLRTIKWHMIAESANDFGLPKHQIEENVQSLKVVPLWGLDFLHPVHGMFANKLDSEVGRKAKDAKAIDVKLNFVPTLTALVKGTRAVNLSQADIEQATRALVNLNTYFQDSRHWSAVWTSDVVKESWRHLWLTDDMLNAKPSSERFDTEWPTLGHLDTALELWYRYLFVFSIPIPERVPSVFQASHHSVSASYGIVCKIKRQCTLQIWDHAISWRETNLYLSSALCTLPPFIRNSLLGLMRLTSTLVLHHADQILPCADFFNPAWETEIGTSQGTIEHRNAFKRKIDPIVNGIADMQKFEPVEEILTKKPTVTMLSHVWYAKDIKTALLAADIIINEWGFDDYHLDIYGALNKAPVYSSECQEIIASKGLAHSVILRGTADPAMVLASSWLFLNSSISEGLPLALGEAALTGAPVVCTDVGASLRVLTDQENDQRYSGVVAPNDPYALARAQINLLAMLDEWSLYAQDSPEHPAPVLKQRPTAEEVATITRRIYEKTPERRMLGMRARNIVQKSFSGERYLREHEQMLWIGRNEHEMRTDVTPSHLVSNSESTAHSPERDRAMEVSDEPIDLQLVKMAHPRRPYIRHPALGTSFSTVGDGVASPTRSLLSTYDDSTNDAGIAYLQKPEAAWLNFVRSER
ncbi:hypothetical protein LTR66_000493 [Elasticomyces elasticus]|nr:hypothetical protein LTR66_000493 [Elasticomyces elasticus]